MKQSALVGFLITCTGVSSASAADSCAAGDDLFRSAFQGEVFHSDGYIHVFGEGHTFVLQPVEFGWDIAVFDSSGAALNVIVPASGIPRENPRALLGRHFRDDTRDSLIATPPIFRRVAFGLDATNPELHPGLTIVPTAPGVSTAPGAGTAPNFGSVELEVLDLEVEEAEDGSEPRLAYMQFRGCLEWTMPAGSSALNGTMIPGHDDVIFPGFDPQENLLLQAMIHFSAMADQLDLAATGEIDAETANERIEAARSALRDLRATWREADERDRIDARASQRADLDRFAARLDRAIKEYEASEYRDYGLTQRLQTPPLPADFLREPPIEAFNGLYRSGFEMSDFYVLAGGAGPWWLETTDENWDELQSYLVPRPGRGSSVTVALTVTGWRETEGGYGNLGAYNTRIHVESIEAIRAITPEEFDLATNPSQ